MVKLCSTDWKVIAKTLLIVDILTHKTKQFVSYFFNFKMFQTLCIFVFCFLSVVISSDMKYSVPKATIRPFVSKGFSVSIPDSPGLKIFAFHGSINTELDSLEAGTFSKDILQPEDGLWIFSDASTKLNVGDVINYWLFVEKDGLGYRQDLQKFVVKGE